MWLNAFLVALGIVVLCIHQLTAVEMPTDSLNQKADISEERPLIVELYFNDNSTGIQRCYEIDDDIWIPFDLFHEHANLPEIQDSFSTTTIKTTLGSINFSTESLKQFEGLQYISLEMLKKSFHAYPLFNNYLYAIKIVIPWAPLYPSKETNKQVTIVPDITAPKSSLSFLHIESDLSHQLRHTTSSYLELEAGGRFSGGTWDIMGKGDPAESLSLSRYHWTSISRYNALRIGTGTSQTYNLLENLEYTGLQFAWNNKGIMRHLDNTNYSDADVLLNIGSTQRRTIEGTGPPAGIAELRFDGYVAARQRIPFNGRFIFRNVRMTTDLRITEVYLYNHSLLEKPAHIIDYSLSLANRSLEKHEILAHGAVGNVLDDDNSLGALTGFGHILYGLNRRITLESALQYNPRSESMDFLIGPVISIGSGWNAAFYGAQANGRRGADISLFGHGKTWHFTQRTLWHQKGFGYDTREARQRHLLRLQTRPFSWLAAVLYGNYTKEGDSTSSKYLLPGGTFRLSSRARLSASPDNDRGDYRYEAYLSPRYDTDIRLQYDDEIITATIDYDFSGSDNTLQFIHSYEPKNQTHASSIYLNLSPGEAGKNRIQFGSTYSQSGLGFTGSWNRTINTGLHFNLAYRHNIYYENAFSIDEFTFLPEEDRTQQTISFSLAWGLGRSNSRFYPINRTAISHTRGGMAGSLKVMTGSGIPQSSINDVAILINGRRLGQRQIGGSFFIGNLKPGIYNVSVDPENLPLELVVERQNIKVEVRSGSVTEVTIPVYAEYGAAGKVCTLSEHTLAGAEVTIIDSEGNTIKQTQTDQFGYYRVDGLRQGAYTARAATSTPDPGGEGPLCETEFTITNNFLFDVDIVIPEEARPNKPSNALQTNLP